jgi:hypothetical protein
MDSLAEFDPFDIIDVSLNMSGLDRKGADINGDIIPPKANIKCAICKYVFNPDESMCSTRAFPTEKKKEK